MALLEERNEAHNQIRDTLEACGIMLSSVGSLTAQMREIEDACGVANSHRKDGYLRALFHRIKARRGWGNAIVAVAHKLIVIAYHLLRDGVPYRDSGGDYSDHLNPKRAVERLLAPLERLGYPIATPAVGAPEPDPVDSVRLRRGRTQKQALVNFRMCQQFCVRQFFPVHLFR